MLIDWFTVGAQVLNFVILAWLMKHFLYKPILNAIDAREHRIATELASAARQETEAQQERDTFQKKNQALDEQHAELLEHARSDADTEREKLMDAAREAADALALKRQTSLASEAKTLGLALRARTQAEVFAITRQTLTDLAGVSLESSICDAFIARLQSLAGEPKAVLVKALNATQSEAVVRSAFELPGPQRQALQQAITDTLGHGRDLRYEVDPSLVGGIELMAQGQKLAWTISDYLASLERGVSDLLKAPAAAP